MIKIEKIHLPVIFYIILSLVLTILGTGTDDNTLLAAAKYFTDADITTGKSYFIHGLIPSAIMRALTILFLLFLILKGYGEIIFGVFLKRFNSFFVRTFVSILIIFSLINAVRLPFVIYIQYIRGVSFAMVKMDFVTWALRFAGQSIISIFVMTSVISLFIVVVKKTKYYLVYIPVLFFITGLFLSILYPRFITPLFYDTVPLTDTALKNKINILAERGGLQVNDVRVVNKSAYISAANAYLIGFGSGKMIVLYDSLLKEFKEDEILSIVAHEMCHFKEEHMLTGMLLGSGGVFFMLIFLKISSRLFRGRDIREMTATGGHPFLILMTLIILFLSYPLQNFISRFMEHRADSFALQLLNKPDAFIAMKVRISRANKLHVTPNKIYSCYYYSHPAILERIKHAETYRLGL